MNSYNQLIGLPVFVQKSEKRIAVINDILFDTSQRIIIGLVVERRNLFKHSKYIPLDEIEQISNTFVTIRSKDSIKIINSNDSLYKLIRNSNPFSINSSIYHNNGQRIGKINDILFNFEIGVIDSYIVSNGVIEDIISGRKLLLDENIRLKRGKLFLNN